jgi:hypothetical protein
MPPIVDVWLRQRQAFGLRCGNTVSVTAKIRQTGFLTHAAKQVVAVEWVVQKSGIYGIRMWCVVAESSSIRSKVTNCAKLTPRFSRSMWLRLAFFLARSASGRRLKGESAYVGLVIDELVIWLPETGF